jgi:predicted Zn-dependent protease
MKRLVILGFGPRSARALLLALAVGCTLSGCAKNPVTGKREFSLVSSDQELAIGRDGHEAILQQYGRYDDPEVRALVERVGMRIARTSHLPNLDWHFTVLDDPVVNAFALPGGYIYITRGILAHLNSEAQLAGVLGHEVGHVTARHSAQRITQQQLYGLGLGLATVFSETFRQYSDAAQTALGLVFLKYGRDDENQADELGIQYSLAAGYDPREIPGTYTMLGRVSDRAGQRLPGFLSTHPDPGDRETRTQAMANKAAGPRTDLEIAGPEFVQQLDRMVYGTDPRNGFFEEESYYHPALRFQIRFPRGWKTQDQRAAVLAVEPNQQAGMQLSLANAGTRSPAEFVAELKRSGQIADATGGSDRIGGYPAWAGRFLVVTADGERGSLLATYIRKSPELMFEILGQSQRLGDANEDRIISSMRTFRELTDPGRLGVEPDRVEVATASRSGSFSSLVGGFGSQAIDIEETSILNNRYANERLDAGELIKIVTAGRKR